MTAYAYDNYGNAPSCLPEAIAALRSLHVSAAVDDSGRGKSIGNKECELVFVNVESGTVWLSTKQYKWH